MPKLDLQPVELDLQPVEEPDESLLDLKEVENEAVNTLRLADETENPIGVIEDFYKPVVEEENQLKPFFKEEWKTQGKIGLTEQIRRMDSVDWASRFPFSPVRALYTLDVYQAVKRLQKDDYVNLPESKRKTRTTPTEMLGVYKYTTLTPAEQRQYDVELLEQYFLKMNEEQTRGTTFGAKVFSGATYLPAWMIEFFLTGGLDQIGNKAAKETAEKMLQSYARTRGGQVVLKAAGWTGGVLTRATLGMPHRIAHETIKRQIPKQMYFGANDEFIFDIDPESWEMSIFKGWLHTVIEVGSEQAGKGITTGTKSLVAKLPFGGKVLNALSKLRPGESVERFFTRGGWSNLYGEIGEERLATILHAICNTEDFGTGANSTILERLKAGISQDIQNFPVELAVLSLPSGVRYVGGKIAEITPTQPAEAITPAEPTPAALTEIIGKWRNLKREVFADGVKANRLINAYYGQPVKGEILPKPTKQEIIQAISKAKNSYSQLKLLGEQVEKANLFPTGDALSHGLDGWTRAVKRIPAEWQKEIPLIMAAPTAPTAPKIAPIKPAEAITPVTPIEPTFIPREISQRDRIRILNQLKESKSFGKYDYGVNEDGSVDVYNAVTSRQIGRINPEGKIIEGDIVDFKNVLDQEISKVVASEEIQTLRNQPILNAERIKQLENIISGKSPEALAKTDIFETPKAEIVRQKAQQLANKTDKRVGIYYGKDNKFHLFTTLNPPKGITSYEAITPEIPEAPAVAKVEKPAIEPPTESERNQFTSDAAAIEATESAKQYLNQPQQEDISAEEPSEDDVGFIRNILHNLGIKDKGDYEPFEDKDYRDIYKFVQMPYDVALSFPQFSPIYETQRAREQAKATLDLYFAQQLQPYFQLDKKSRTKIDNALCEYDRNLEQVYGHKQLKKMGLNIKETKGFLSVITSFDEALNMMVDEMKKSGVKKEVIDDFVAKAKHYIPHKWYGNWVISVQEKKGKRKLPPTKLEVAEAALEGRPSELRIKETELKRPQTVFMTKTNYTDRFKERERLQKLYPDNDVVIIKANKIPYQAFQESAPWAVGKMVDLVIEKSEANPETAAAMREALSDLYKSKGFGMHFIKRKNIPGYTEDLSRPIAEYFSGFTGYITKMQAIQNFSENITAIRPQRTPNLYRYSLDYIKYVTGEQMEFAKAKRVAYFYYLFGNLKSATLNATQNFTMGWPVLSKHTGFALPKIMQAMARTTPLAMLTEGEKQFIKELENAGYLQPQLTQEISGYVGNPLFSGIKSEAGKIISFADLFRHMESYNRRSMAVAVYDSGITDIEEAGKIIEEAHFRYGKGNRPVLARGYISPVMVFRSWGINYFTWVKNEIKAGRIAPEIKSLLAITFLGGLKALPFASLFVWIWRKVFGTDPEAELRNALGEKAGQFVARGAPSQIGISFTGSISPMDVPTPTDIDTFQKTITEIGGVFADVPIRVGRVTKSLAVKNYLRALEDASPEALRNPLAAYRLYEEGARSRSGRTVLDLETGKPQKLTAGEMLAKMAGYQPVRMSEQYDLQKALDQFGEERKGLKQNWADRYWLAFLDDDPDSMNEVTQEIIDYNAKMERRNRKEDMISVDEMDDMLISRARPLNIPSSYMMPKYQKILNKFYRRKAEKIKGD